MKLLSTWPMLALTAAMLAGSAVAEHEIKPAVLLAFRADFNGDGDGGKFGEVSAIWKGSQDQCEVRGGPLLRNEEYVKRMLDLGYSGFLHVQFGTPRSDSKKPSTIVLGKSYTLWIKKGVVTDCDLPEVPGLKDTMPIRDFLRVLGLIAETQDDQRERRQIGGDWPSR